MEHFSIWLDIVGVFGEREVPYNVLTTKLQQYLAKGIKYPIPENPALKQTLTIIPFEMYTSEGASPEKVFKVNSLLLAASMESARRAGFGRVVVVGMEEEDDKIAQGSFRLLQSEQEKQQQQKPHKKTSKTTLEMKFIKGTVAVPTVPLEGHKHNVPKATLFGLRRAFDLASQLKNNPGQVSPDEQTYIKEWLGEHPDSYWQYIFLSEADNILNMRHSVLQSIKEQVDNGMVVVPHRLLLLPSESDIATHSDADRTAVIARKGDFWDAKELDVLAVHPDICCDDHLGPDRKPGKETTGFTGECPPGKPWYACEFGDWNHPRGQHDHERLKKYKLIRLTQGTGLAIVTSTEQGRRCSPKEAIQHACLQATMKRIHQSCLGTVCPVTFSYDMKRCNRCEFEYQCELDKLHKTILTSLTVTT